MDTQNTVSSRVTQNLNEPLSFIDSLGSTVGSHRELANFVLDTRGLKILFVLANPGNLWMCVDDGGHAVVVHVRHLAIDNRLNADNALVLGLVRQHGPRNAITDCVDAWHTRLESAVGLDLATLVHGDSNVFQAESSGVWTTTNADQKSFALKLLEKKTTQMNPDIFKAMNNSRCCGCCTYIC